LSSADTPRSQPPLPAVDALYEEAPCGLLVTDGAGLVLRANATFCRWAGIEQSELVGKRRFQDLLTVGGRIFHHTHWAPLLRMQGSVSEIKLDLQVTGAKPVPLVLNALRSVRDGHTLHELAVFVAEDRHAYERELLLARQQAEGLLSQEKDRSVFAEQMVGIVSHDLRNPLSTMSMAAELLGRLGPDVRQAPVIEGLARSVLRARRLIDDLLDFTQARIGRGLPIKIVPLDIHDVVARHVEDLAQSYPDRKFHHVSEGDPRCGADGDRVFQLLGNLVANAVAYGDPGAAITIRSTCRDGHASLEVHNLGRPISAELLPTMFQPMVRGSEAPSGTRSVGLGLFIVSEIARAHGGHVAVTSTNEDGTRFVATWPAGPQ